MNKKILIHTNKLCKSFITGKTSNNVLKNIDLDIYEGDFTIIMGSSGSGKSTLLYSLSSMDRPTSGEVVLLGEELTKLNEKKIAAVRKQAVSFIFQGINLLPDLTAFENIAYAGYGNSDKKAVNARATELLERFGISADGKSIRESFPAGNNSALQSPEL